MTMIVDRHLTEDFAKDHELQASLRQAAHNNKLKKVCLDNEENSLQLHSGEYTDSVQYQLMKAHEKAEQLIASLEAGLKWNLQTSYDLSKLMRQCGLELALQELYTSDTSPNYYDFIPLKKEFVNVKKQTAKAADNGQLLTAADLGGAINRTVDRLEEIEKRVMSSQLDASEMAHIVDPVIPKIKECLVFVRVDEALRRTDDAITERNNVLTSAKQAQQKAVTEGEMAVAEDASYTIITTLEQLMELIGDKFAILNNKSEENSKFFEVFDILKDSNKKTLKLKMEKRRLAQRCCTDLDSVHSSIGTNDAKDVKALKEFAVFMSTSEEAIRQNLETQNQLWKDKVRNKYTTLLPDVISDLRRSGRERYDLVMSRIEHVDKEEQRKVEYQQYLEVVAYHKKTLELTITNCNTAVACVGIFEQIMNDLCTAVRNWHDIVKDDLHTLRVSVHKEHLSYFREMYLTIGNLLFKKEKKVEDISKQLRLEHIQLEFCIETFDLNAKQHSEAKKELIRMKTDIEEEINMLKAKAEQALEEFLESEEALKEEGYEFIHPAVEFEDIISSQRDKMLSYKLQFSKEEDVRIAAEREELRRLAALSPSRSQQIQAPAFSPTSSNGTPKKLEYY